ncbi:MAG: retroviral-like aspartic protease family protein [Azoarcus sp.]|jgi:aspartyl protease family protein|nr:retroviral-like aspartic protease family protein [Azoarcus sp.]
MGKTLFCWLALPGLIFAIQAGAAGVAVSGIFGKKAVLVVGDAAPRTVAVGQSTPEGVKVLEISGDTVMVEVDGRQERLRIGEQVVSREGLRREGSSREGSSGEDIWIEESSGRFYVDGHINSRPARFKIDTGASRVLIGRSDARRLGLNLATAQRGRNQSASGPGMVWFVKLNRVKVGGIERTNVDASVLENDMPYILLGMGFLRHVEMMYDGSRLRLRKIRFPANGATRIGKHSRSEDVWIEMSSGGRFYVEGHINRGSARFKVDTGATRVAIGQSDARRLGLDLTRAQRDQARTPNGPSMVWLVKLDRVKVGGVELTNVDAMVHENDRPYVSLGMSFLRHVEIIYDGKYMRLRKRS